MVQFSEETKVGPDVTISPQFDSYISTGANIQDLRHHERGDTLWLSAIDPVLR